MLVIDEKASELQARVEPSPNDRTTDAGESRTASGTGRTASSSSKPASSSVKSSSSNSTAEASLSDGSESAATTQEETVHTLSPQVSGLPSGKIYDMNQGVLKPLTAKAGAFEFTIEFEVSSDDGIPTKTIEQNVIETLRQLGTAIGREEVE